MDLVRASSIVVVVLGHYLIAAVERRHGHLHGSNVLTTTPWLRPATWAFQVMPLFFFVGGFTNARALRPGSRDVGSFICRRVERLTTPSLVFAAAWVATVTISGVAGADAATVREAARIAAQPLWFLAVYLLTIAMAPLQQHIHRRSRWSLLVALPLLVALVDTGRLTGVAGGVADVNYVLVFLFAQELGFLYADGVLQSAPPARMLAVAIGVVGLLLALTTAGPYPVSMVGVPGEQLSNMSPPTTCIVLLTIAQTAALMAVRRPLERLLQSARVWRATVAANGLLLTVFLWHLTAFVIVAAVLTGVHVPLPRVGSPPWWALKPLWIALALTTLALPAGIFAPIERRSLVARPQAGRGTASALLAVVAVAAGMAAIAATGFTDLFDAGGRRVLGLQVAPITGILLLAAGWTAVVTRPSKPRRSTW